MKEEWVSQRNWFIAVVVLLVAASIGCGPSAPKLYPATGSVTFEGKPVDGASVVFIPQEGRPSMALTDSSGKFTLTTSGQPGAPVGTYTVTISKQSSATVENAGSAPVPQATGGEPTEEDLKKMQAQQKQMAEQMRAATKEPPKSLIPAKYASPVASGLSKEVTTDASKNVFDFNLTP